MDASQSDRLGGVSSIVLGVAYVVAGASFLFTPEHVRSDDQLGLHLAQYAEGPTTARTIFFCAYLTIVFSAFAALPAIVGRLDAAGSPAVRWATKLAYLGFGVLGLTASRWLALEGALADALVRSDPRAGDAIAALAATLPLDPDGWLLFGGVGIWAFVVSLEGLVSRELPVPFGVIGLAGAAAYGCAIAGNALSLPMLLSIAAGAGGLVLAPLWYVGLGVWLLRGRPAASA